MDLGWAVRVRDARALRLSDRDKAQLESDLALAL